jgi:hypothetical protein
MRRSVKITLLALGTVLGYGFAFHSMRYHHGRREAFERHVADVCVRAADSVKTEKAAPKTNEPTPQ